MGGIVFINYRRKDAEHVAGRLFDRLERDFGQDRLFFDVDNIPPGEDFVDYLNRQVEACDVLLALVGPNWQDQLDTQDYDGEAQTRDFVRIEIEAALAQGKKVIPVLVSGAEMPREEDLPQGLRPFSRRNAVRLSHERFRADAAGITYVLKTALAAAEDARAEDARAEETRQRTDIARETKTERENKTEREAQEKKNTAPGAGRLREGLRGGRLTRRTVLLGAGAVAIIAAIVTAVAMQGSGGPVPVYEAVRTFKAKSVEAITFSPDSLTALTAGLRPRLWDMTTGDALDGFDDLNVWDVAFSPDGRKAVTAGHAGIKLWDAASGEELPGFKADGTLVHRIAFSPDARALLTLMSVPDADGMADDLLGVYKLVLLDAETGEELRTFAEGKGVRSWQFSSDGRTVWSSDFGKMVQWDVATGKLISTIEPPDGYYVHLDIAPDGRKMLSKTADNAILLWDLETGKLLHTLDGHDGPVHAAAFSPDGRFALSGGADMTLRLWDLATGEELGVFEGHTDDVGTVAFAPDGRTALSGSWEGELKLWEIPRHSWWLPSWL